MQNIRISLEAARVNAKLTQKEVCEKMHISGATLISWENGTTEPKISQARELSNLYEMPLDYISLP